VDGVFLKDTGENLVAEGSIANIPLVNGKVSVVVEYELLMQSTPAWQVIAMTR
jgi:hypothetical protein